MSDGSSKSPKRQPLQAVKGTHDILPAEAGAWPLAILGDDELAQGAWMLRDMKTSSQQPVPLPALV